MGSTEDEEPNSLEASHWQEPHFLWRTSKKVAAGQDQTENWPSLCLLTGQLTRCLHACGELTQELDLAGVKQTGCLKDVGWRVEFFGVQRSPLQLTRWTVAKLKS